MNIMICSIYEDDEKDYYKANSKIALAESSDFHEKLIIRGLRELFDLYLVNTPANGCFPKRFKKPVIRRKQRESSVRIGYINLPVIKQLQKTLNIYREIKKLVPLKGPAESIIVYSPYLPMMYPAYRFACKHRQTKLILFVPDLPEYFNTSSKKKVIQTFMKKMENKVIKKILWRFDGFVYVAEPMKFKMDPDKPYIIQEGSVYFNETNETSQAGESYFSEYPADIKTITYTGTLQRKYGIVNLLNAFHMTDNEKYRLVICGSGEAETDIRNMMNIDKRIIFPGQVNHDTILKIQKSSTMLVNPRTSEGEYTKYSFPIKTMEYLYSARPVIANRLPGYPLEYDDYLLYPDSETVEDLYKKILQICETPEFELKEIGRKGREFVLKEKNYKIQAERMVRFIKNINREKAI